MGTGVLVTFGTTATTSVPPQAVIAVLRDLPAHLEWAGSRSSQTRFRLLTLEAAAAPATVGARFSSTGAAMNGTFHDTSVVTVADAGSFGFETTSRLDRRHGAELRMRFAHRYDVQPDAAGSRIVYSCRGYDASYVPYWLRPVMRSLTRSMINRSMRTQLAQLVALAEARSLAPAAD